MTDLAVGAAERALTDVERTTAKADGPAVLEQQPLRQKKSERAERLCHHLTSPFADRQAGHPAIGAYQRVTVGCDKPSLGIRARDNSR